MRFHVLGIGAIGSLVSHHLRRSLPDTHKVILIHKHLKKALDAQDKGYISVERSGVIQKSTGFSSELFQGRSTRPRSETGYEETQAQEESADEVREESNIESLFITAKAHQTLPAVRRLLPRLSAHSTIVLLQNGMGIYEELVKELFRNPISRPHFILASNTHGVYSKVPFEVVHAGVGATHFGIVPDPTGRNFEAGFDPQSFDSTGRLSDITQSESDPQFHRYKSLRNTVAALLVADGLNPSWEPMEEIQLAMRRKVVVNSVVNPLTALLGCRNGDVFNSDASLRMLRDICREAERLFTAEATERHNESIRNGLVDENAPFQLHRLLQAKALEQECLRVAEATKFNISSMLSDIRKGSPVTEVNYLNGWLMRLGTKYQIRIPTIVALWRLIYMRTTTPIDQMF